MKVYIIHRWDGSPKADWYPWLEKELRKKGFEVFVPEMPDTSHPKIDKWVGHLSKIVKDPDEQTFFVGHSIGCQTILRFLEKSGKKVGGAIFVGGFLKPKPLDTEEEKLIVSPWLETPIDFKKIKMKHFVGIFSDNDPYIPLNNGKLFQEKLGGKIIVEKNKGHFMGSDGVKELPIVLEELVKM